MARTAGHQSSAKSWASSITIASNSWPAGRCRARSTICGRKAVLPVVAVVVGSRGGTPGMAEPVELTDVGRSFRDRQCRHLAAQELRQAAGIAQQRNPPAGRGHPPGLFQGQPGLPAARPAADLDPVQQLHGTEDQRLVLGEPADAFVAILCLGQQIALGATPAGEDVKDQIHVHRGQRAQVVVLVPQDRPSPVADRIHLGSVDDHPARAIRHREVGTDLGVWQHDSVRPPHPTMAAGPPGVALHIGAQRVPRLPGLPDRVDGDVGSATGLAPLPVLQPDAAALDLEHDDAEPWRQHDEIGFVVLGPVGDAHPRQHRLVVEQLVDETDPHAALGGAREGGMLRTADRHVRIVPEFVVPGTAGCSVPTRRRRMLGPFI